MRAVYTVEDHREMQNGPLEARKGPCRGNGAGIEALQVDDISGAEAQLFLGGKHAKMGWILR